MQKENSGECPGECQVVPTAVTSPPSAERAAPYLTGVFLSTQTTIRYFRTTPSGWQSSGWKSRMKLQIGLCSLWEPPSGNRFSEILSRLVVGLAWGDTRRRSQCQEVVGNGQEGNNQPVKVGFGVR